MTVVGITGMMMAFSLVATRYMPGWGLNVALWIHRLEAFLAMADLVFLRGSAHKAWCLLRYHNPAGKKLFTTS